MVQHCLHLGHDPMGPVAILNAMEPPRGDALHTHEVNNARYGAILILRAAAEGRQMPDLSVDTLVRVFQAAESSKLISSATTLVAENRPSNHLSRNMEIALGLIEQSKAVQQLE